jgi:hypothetical protein
MISDKLIDWIVHRFNLLLFTADMQPILPRLSF